MLPFKAIYPGHYEHRAGEWLREAGITAGVAKSGGKSAIQLTIAISYPLVN